MKKRFFAITAFLFVMNTMAQEVDLGINLMQPRGRVGQVYDAMRPGLQLGVLVPIPKAHNFFAGISYSHVMLANHRDDFEGTVRMVFSQRYNEDWEYKLRTNHQTNWNFLNFQVRQYLNDQGFMPFVDVGLGIIWNRFSTLVNNRSSQVDSKGPFNDVVFETILHSYSTVASATLGGGIAYKFPKGKSALSLGAFITTSTPGSYYPRSYLEQVDVFIADRIQGDTFNPENGNHFSVTPTDAGRIRSIWYFTRFTLSYHFYLGQQ
jgi:hypothetical protein